MKNLKFRVWKAGQMIYSDDRKWNMPYEFFEQACLDFDDVMVSTGVKDKNGTEIFEGDKVSFRKTVGFIEYFAGMFIISFDDQSDSGPIGFITTEDMEIVGHIYDTK